MHGYQWQRRRAIRGARLLAIAALLTAPLAVTSPARAASSPWLLAGTTINTTDYPWAGLKSGVDGWGMGYGQCVSYAAWMIYQNDGGAQHPPKIPDPGWFPSDGNALSPVTYPWGSAGYWAGSAAQHGYTVDHTPTVGAIAEWNVGGDKGQFSVGHVAYVTAVYSDGSVDLSQYNLREDSAYSTLHLPTSGTYDTSNGHPPFWVSWPDNFLHIYDANPAATPPYTEGMAYGQEQEVFTADVKGALHHWYWNPASNGVQQQNWGGSLIGTPASFVYSDEQHVFAEGPGGQLQHWYWAPGGTVHQQSWGGQIYSNPTAFVYGDQQHVFGQGASGQLVHWYWSPSSNGIQTQDWGGSVAGDPAGYAYGPKQEQDVFAIGSDGHLHHWYWSPRSNGVQQQDWGGTDLVGSPAAFANGTEQDAFAIGGNGHLYRFYWSPSSGGVKIADWGTSPNGTLVGRPTGFAANGELHVYAMDSSGQLHHWYLSPGGTAQQQNLGGSLAESPFSFYYAPTQEQEVFAVGTDRHLHQWYWSPTSNGEQTQDWSGDPA